MWAESRKRSDRSQGRLCCETHLDLPTGDKHCEHPAQTTVGAIRSGRQAREEGDDAGRSHLDVRVHTRARSENCSRDQMSIGINDRDVGVAVH